ncbi:GGDEF domain-containing protein [Salipaludibacillus aurantiacus]|uniref:PAS domain S-box-containing protein/diguanylate cyclase (GGDEF) domain-containing protein n=1 Tax=Salipaludibacillus aurantiacus TaxID=1601833 RepID=A0A1H9SFV8_9BACI|nr:GGDEF domain-containing protein [Salipaludibacillus aurantiacus]SER83892.1 PAS domain S-box-containing protein/diguanylate cyclase (GGDEF) domain-containing protein [Salipaludibacillus aurantiacus]
MRSDLDSCRLFEKAFHFSSIGMALVSTEGQFMEANSELCNMFGYSEDEMTHKTFQELTHPDDLRESVRTLQQLISGKKNSARLEKKYICKNGAVIWVLLNVSAVHNDKGETYYFISQFQNISEQKFYEKRLMESEERLTQILQTVPSGVTIADVQGRIIFANEMAEEILTLNESEVTKRQFDSALWKIKTIDGHAIKSEDLPFSLVMASKKRVRDYILTIQTNNNQRKILSVNAAPLFDHKGEPEQVVFSIIDITHKKNTECKLTKANQLLKKLSESDGLTGLPNRRYFDEQLQTAWTECEEAGLPLSLVMFDLDNFKKYNDYYGHQEGDDCLKVITAAINKRLEHETLTLARYGGEEFSIILPGYSEKEALRVADIVHKTVLDLKLPHAQSTVSSFITVSLGVSAVFPDPAGNPEELVREADRALYSAKEEGRSCVKVYRK